MSNSTYSCYASMSDCTAAVTPTWSVTGAAAVDASGKVTNNNLDGGCQTVTLTARYQDSNGIMKSYSRQIVLVGSDNPVPDAPTVTAGNGTYSNQVVVTWTASAKAKYYKLYRSTAATDGTTEALTGWTTSRTYTDTNIVADKSYYYSVQASSDGGMFNSGLSARVLGYADSNSPIAKTLENITISGNATIASSGTATYTCKATYSDNSTATVTPSWSLSSTTYAGVSTSGVVTSKNTTYTDQTVTLTASYGGKTASKSITLTGKTKTLTSIAISGNATIASSGTATYTCTATYSDNSTGTVTPTWSLSSTTYAGVSTSGVVTSKNTTTTNQTVTLTASYGGKTASKSITLTGKTKTLTSIAISGNATIASSGTATYTCKATYSDNSTGTVTPTWSLSSTTYAGVSTSGVVTSKNTSTTNQAVTLNASYTYGGVTKTASKSVTLAGADPEPGQYHPADTSNDNKISGREYSRYKTPVFNVVQNGLDGAYTWDGANLDPVAETRGAAEAGTETRGAVGVTRGVSSTTYGSTPTEITVTFTVRGAETLSQLYITEKLPAGWTFVSSEKGSHSAVNGTVIFEIEKDIPETLSYVVKSPANPADTYTLSVNRNDTFYYIGATDYDLAIADTVLSKATYHPADADSDGKISGREYARYKTPVFNVVLNGKDGAYTWDGTTLTPYTGTRGDVLAATRAETRGAVGMARSVSSATYGTTPAEITVTFTVSGAETLSQLFIIEKLPAGWTFVSSEKGSHSTVNGTVIFEFETNIPKTFSYVIKSPANPLKSYTLSVKDGDTFYYIGTNEYDLPVADTTLVLATAAPTLTSIAISGSDTIASGGTATYTCTATYSDNSTGTVTPTWSLSSTTYASVSTSGVVTSKNTTYTDQTVTLTASYTYGGTTKTASKSVKLTGKTKTLTSIAISGSDTIASGGTATYTCKATYSDNTTATVTPTWSLSSTTYASVSAAGVVTSKNTTYTDQTVTLTASYTYGGVTKTASKSVKLTGKTKTLTSIAISGSDTIASSGTATYTCKATYSDNTTATVIPSWSLSSTTYASVSTSGVVTSKNTTYTDQTVTLTASHGGKTASKSVTALGKVISQASVTSVSLAPHWPWNGLVDITYTVAGGENLSARAIFTGHDNDRDKDVAISMVTGPGADTLINRTGTYTVTWNAAADMDITNSSSLVVQAELVDAETSGIGKSTYLVVDLSGGKDATSYPVRYTDTAPDVTQDTCRTTELWLRKIPAGTFTMGSPEDELGRGSNETQHQVTLTQDYYIGVFECTQRQWELVMGTRPSYFSNADYHATRPVECVSYNMIRGTGKNAGAGWPEYGHTVDAKSFMGKIQQKTGLVFDLPTEAQWEYACRRKADGTCWSTALNSGKNLTNESECPNLAEIGRYWNNGGSSYSSTCTTTSGTAKVGSYQPSELGLYDMHGNVWEWCLDWYWYASYNGDATNPTGATSGSYRVIRGGSWSYYARYCRAAYRYNGYPSNGNRGYGFRLACFPLSSD